MLLDPLEEQFDLPTTAVELGDGERGQREIVGQKDQCLVGLCGNVNQIKPLNHPWIHWPSKESIHGNK